MESTCAACTAVLPADARFCPSCGSSTSGRPAPMPHAERRPVTVLFADAVGSTAFTERAGDEAAYRFVQRCVATMSASIERHGGTITQFRGDGVMALFGAPVARENSAVDAVTAALEIQSALADLTGECDFRVGLSTGPVVVGSVGDDVLLDYTAIGDTANVAARMEQAATPGSVFISESTWRAVREFVECRSVGALEVKGKSTSVSAHEAIRRRAIRTRLEAAVERGLGPFVGRARELDLLRAHVDALGDGRGHVVEVVGEAGMGKSRLLLELRRSLPAEISWIEGHCAASGTDTPYLAIAHLLRNAFGIEESDDPATIMARVEDPYLRYVLDVDPGDDTATTTDARLRRAAILDALRTSVADAARRQPRVLVIEDVHWADAASLDALGALAGVTESAPVLLLTTSRPGAAAPFAATSTLSRVGLDGISDDDATAMAASALDVDNVPDDVAALIATRADGNPLFVEELTATLVEAGLVVREEGDLRLTRPAESIDVPDTLQEIILARIDRLAREARDALQLAAVIGREFTVRLLDRLAGLPDGIDDALDELKSVELIRQKAWFPELAYLFKHALTHEVTYSTLLDERRRALHRLVAQAIEDVYADRLGEHVESLAHHWSVAEEWGRALDFLERAGDAAASVFSNDAAVGFYEQAIAIALREGDEARAIDIGSRLGDVHLTTGNLDEAVRVLERTAELARRVGDHDALAWALTYRGEALSYQHKISAGEQSLLAALDIDEASVPPRLYAATWLSLVRTVSGRHDEVAAVEPILAELGSSGPIAHERTNAAVQSLLGLRLRWRGETEAALEILTGPMSTNDLLIGSSIQWELGTVQAERGLYDDGIATLTAGIDQAARAGELMFRARSMNTLGWLRGEIGDIGGAIAWNERCLAFLTDVQIPDEEIESNTRLNLAEIHLRQGDLAACEQQLERVDDINRDRPVRWSWMVWRFRQRLLLLQTLLDLARGATSTDGRLEESHALASESGSRKYLGKIDAARALAMVRSRELDGAAVHARQALDVAVRIHHPPEQWRSHALLAAIADGRGDADAARGHRAAADAVLAGVEGTLRDPAGLAGVRRLRAGIQGEVAG